ncbi:hypothetical protein OQA88_5402 [Cercophora sp. LCS_1]
MFCTFAVENHPGRRRTRSKFSSEARDKVRRVRERKACLRCRVLKVPCSGEDPCQRCMDLATRASRVASSSALTWSLCVRTSFRDVNLFSRVCDESAVSAGLAALASHTLKLAFDVSWNYDELVQAAITWFRDDNEPSKSMVGTLSSNEFKMLTANHLDASLVSDVCSLLYATSKAHVNTTMNTDGSPLNVASLSEVAYFCGNRVINRLDDLLSSRPLANATKETLQAKLLVVVAVILALGYATPVSDSPSFSDILDGQAGSPTSTLWDAMRQHICEMLAHYLIVIASKLHFRFQHNFQKSLITSALNQWGKKARFTWVEYDWTDWFNQDEPKIQMTCSRERWTPAYQTAMERMMRPHLTSQIQASATRLGVAVEASFGRMPPRQRVEEDLNPTHPG